MTVQSLTERKESIYKIKCYILYIGTISILIYFLQGSVYNKNSISYETY